MKVSLFLPLFLAACGSSSGGDASATSSAGGSGAASGGAKPGRNEGAAGSIDSAGGGSSGKASLANGGGPAGLNSASKPATWNSAKSATLSDEQLQTEYANWKAAHAESCTAGSWVVVNENGKVVSEGIGYGMLLAAAMADQTLFDGLWKYYQEHLDTNGLMNWMTDKCEAPGDSKQSAATDADLDVAMALVQAAARWPNGGYQTKAQALSGKIAQFESDTCSGRRVLRPGDAFGGCSDGQDPRINPSYFSPGYYKVFAHYFPDQAATWTALGDGSYQLYALYQARMANLVPDWSGPDGSDDGSSYSYDACRTPWRVAVDYGWSGDTRAETFMQNISSWVDAHGGLPKAAQAQNSAFIGSFALSGGYEQGKFDSYMSGWLNAKNLDDAPYFQGTLRVLYLLVAAGKFSSTL
ncbi:MAG TPA: glycosyl hydrolase family 8 [Polyangiaceae bacterium]